MAGSNFKKVEITRGPFDPGGQPETRTGEPLELGFFAWNIKGGMTASNAVLDDPLRLQNYWEWPTAMRLVQHAERIGFDYQVPFGRWIGQDGATDFNGAALDFLASAAATAPITTRMGLFSTAHITYRFHPMHIAKFGATIDHISGGRWGLNIVSGYSAKEMAAFGFESPIPRNAAYDMADEFTCLMKHLWTEDERFDFEGEHYQAYGAMIAPKPVRKPRPVLMNAGRSERGLDFAAKHSDWIFTTMPDIAGYRDRVTEIHERAARHGRSVRVATMCWVLPAETDAIAQAKFDDIVDRIDHEAVVNFIASAPAFAAEAGEGFETKEFAGLDKETYTSIALGFGCPRLVGGYDTVAEQMQALHATGLESLLMCFFDPEEGLQQMEDHILPALRKMKLRR